MVRRKHIIISKLTSQLGDSNPNFYLNLKKVVEETAIPVEKNPSAIHFKIQARHSGLGSNYKRSSKFGEINPV